MIDRNLDALPSGLVLDGYRIERELGSGGFGITYLATEIESGRKVAIKEYMPKSFARRSPDGVNIRPVDSESREHFDWGLERFRDEARALIRIRHPNIVLTLRLFSAHGTAYIVMDYVDGESLDAVVKRAGHLSAQEIDEILPTLLDGLSAVHTAGYLHRDLKPSNIYLRRDDGRPVLLDFGAAREALGRETKTLSAIVTPGYSPPEQYGRGAKQKESADIYALGATLYRCISGEAPPEAPDRVSALVTGEADPLLPAAEAGRGQYPRELLSAIDCALSIRDDARPKNIAAFRALLRGAHLAQRVPPFAKPADPATSATLLAREPTPVRSGEAHSSPVSPARRVAVRGKIIGVALTLALAVGAAVTYLSMQRSGVAPGSTFSDCAGCPEMVVIPAGSFMMGSPQSDPDRKPDELPQHLVRLARPFAMGKFEVTFAEWDACVASRGCSQRLDDHGWGRGRLPVINASWTDAQEYVAWLSAKTGKRYRLPSEAEWEYAARAGSTLRHPWGDDVRQGDANCERCNDVDSAQPLPVGSFRPNAFGLFDVIGNVEERVEDCYSNDYEGAPGDGSARAPVQGCNRVIRGGSWNVAREMARVAYRDFGTSGNIWTGFRVVREID